MERDRRVGGYGEDLGQRGWFGGAAQCHRVEGCSRRVAQSSHRSHEPCFQTFRQDVFVEAYGPFDAKNPLIRAPGGDFPRVIQSIDGDPRVEAMRYGIDQIQRRMAADPMLGQPGGDVDLLALTNH